MPEPNVIAGTRPWIALGVLAALLLWETAAPFFSFPAGIKRIRHGFRNVLLGASIGQLALYELLMFAVVQFHHANISVSAKWDRILRLFIVTPYMHKVHHSRWQPETDSNYSSLLSIWDRLFRSFRMIEKPESLRLGLDEFDAPADQTIPGMLKTPVVNVKHAKEKPSS